MVDAVLNLEAIPFCETITVCAFVCFEIEAVVSEKIFGFVQKRVCRFQRKIFVGEIELCTTEVDFIILLGVSDK